MSNRSHRKSRLRPLVLSSAILSALAVAGVLMARSPLEGAAQPIAEISELRCDGDPEVVVVRNVGTERLQMSGWNLQSDPPNLESLPLGVLGFLEPGESVLVESGPSAEASFVWSKEFVFRDNDPTDYARLASDAGVVLLQVNCAEPTPTPTAEATLTPSPTAAATLTPSPTPAALPASATPSTGVVPDGGGPPPDPTLDLAPVLVTALGGSLAMGGLALLIPPVVAGWFASRRRKPTLPMTETLIATVPAKAVVRSSRRRRSSMRPYLLVCIAALSVAAVMVMALQPGDER